MRLESDSMTQKSAIASINAEYSQAKLQLDADEVLAKQGLVAESRPEDLSGLRFKISLIA